MYSAHPLTVLAHECCRIGPLSGRRALLGLTMDARHDHMAIVARPTHLDVHGQKRDQLGQEPVWVFPSQILNARTGRIPGVASVQDGLQDPFAGHTPARGPRLGKGDVSVAIRFRWRQRCREAGLAVVPVHFRHRPRVVRLTAWPLIIATPEALGCMIFDTSQAHPVAIAASYGRAWTRKGARDGRPAHS